MSFEVFFPLLKSQRLKDMVPLWPKYHLLGLPFIWCPLDQPQVWDDISLSRQGWSWNLSCGESALVGEDRENLSS